jgi:hypothetical protein
LAERLAQLIETAASRAPKCPLVPAALDKWGHDRRFRVPSQVDQITRAYQIRDNYSGSTPAHLQAVLKILRIELWVLCHEEQGFTVMAKELEVAGPACWRLHAMSIPEFEHPSTKT